MCGRFQKNHALHTARYSVPRSALDHDQLTHCTPQSLTVSAAVWPSLPARRVSLHAPAEHGKTPAWSAVLSMQLWPPGGSSDIAISEA